ncbi:hypothetical protein APHMUC_0677 [Anaplasma phagocytophilum str. ApMUC09]|uniref:Uncharacterized protein n=1 Tax=Anaplasma phagocytophilum str. ApMUC09 TaxID=1359152 RepID=A0A0F3N7E7_ANAPH|nr:hypothetical protein APHMUC_0677 [Anaplasma phagocytophilum str. ApMUC09]SCV64286.1 hypothetical protein ANAPH2_00902 [Anaplasma phagocytophilum]
MVQINFELKRVVFSYYVDVQFLDFSSIRSFCEKIHRIRQHSI